MNSTPFYLEIIKILVPASLVFLASYFALAAFLKNEQHRRKLELRISQSKTIITTRLQAYERLVLFLERISPESIIFRLQKPKMSSRQLHSGLLGMIRDEFEHNLSQQVYVSPQAWTMVKNAKENMVKLINTCAAEVDPETPAMYLSKKIFEAFADLNQEPVKEALAYIKSEIGELF